MMNDGMMDAMAAVLCHGGEAVIQFEPKNRRL